jgi:NAD(P) transhydrogenase subunit beta
MAAQFTDGVTDVMGIFLLMSSLAMLTVILVTLVYVFSFNAAGTSLTIDTGLAVTAFVASRLWIASMLPMVAFYNIAGGAAASAIAAADIHGRAPDSVGGMVFSLTGALLGAVSLSGSLTAWGKLKGLIKSSFRPWDWKAFSLIPGMAALGYIAVTAQGQVDGPTATPDVIYWISGCGLLLGALITLRISRIQVPAAIYFFNVLCCVAISLGGFALRSPTLICAGILVGGIRLVLNLMMVHPAAT